MIPGREAWSRRAVARKTTESSEMFLCSRRRHESRPTGRAPTHRREDPERDADRERDDRDEAGPAGRVPEGRARDECAHHDAPEVTVGAALDATTVGEVVEVVADVPEVASSSRTSARTSRMRWRNAKSAAVACFAVVAAALAVVPACGGEPREQAGAGQARASDQRVRCLIRRSPSSRSFRFLALRFPGSAAWLFMATIVDHGPKHRLGSR